MPSLHKSRQRGGLSLVAVAVCALAALTACGSSTGSGESPSVQAASTPARFSASSPATVEKPGVVAEKAIKLFARPDMPERRWFTDLLPYLEDEYAEEASYTDPARVPFDKILSGPDLQSDSHNPQLVLARFKTNDGPWTVEMHQDKPGGKWLVGGISKTPK